MTRSVLPSSKKKEIARKTLTRLKLDLPFTSNKEKAYLKRKNIFTKEMSQLQRKSTEKVMRKLSGNTQNGTSAYNAYARQNKKTLSNEVKDLKSVLLSSVSQTEGTEYLQNKENGNPKLFYKDKSLDSKALADKRKSSENADSVIVKEENKNAKELEPAKNINGKICDPEMKRKMQNKEPKSVRFLEESNSDKKEGTSNDSTALKETHLQHLLNSNPFLKNSDDDRDDNSLRLQIDAHFRVPIGTMDIAAVRNNKFYVLVFIKRSIMIIDSNCNILKTLTPMERDNPLLKVPISLIVTPKKETIVIVDGKLGSLITLVTLSRDGSHGKAVVLSYEFTDIAPLNEKQVLACGLVDPEIAIIDFRSAAIMRRFNTQESGLRDCCFLFSNPMNKNIILLSKMSDITILNQNGKILKQLNTEQKAMAGVSIAEPLEVCAVSFAIHKYICVACKMRSEKTFKVIVFDNNLTFLGIAVKDIPKAPRRLIFTKSCEMLIIDNDNNISRFIKAKHKIDDSY